MINLCISVTSQCKKLRCIYGYYLQQYRKKKKKNVKKSVYFCTHWGGKKGRETGMIFTRGYCCCLHLSVCPSAGIDGNYRSREITARRWLHKYVGAECGASSFAWYLYQLCNTDVRVCGNHLLVHMITRDPFKLGSPNSRPRTWP